MPKYRKKPVEVDARQWDGTATNASHIIDWALQNGVTIVYTCSDTDRCAQFNGDTPHYLRIPTLEGNMIAHLNDWIIKGVQGEFYPCKPDIFEATYEAV